MHHNLGKEEREGMAGSVLLLEREGSVKKEGMQKKAMETRDLLEPEEYWQAGSRAEERKINGGHLGKESQMSLHPHLQSTTVSCTQ